MSRIVRTIAVAIGLCAVGSVSQAQTLFTGSGCSGNTFLFCASWTGTYIDATHVSLSVSNVSQNAPSSNTFSAFTAIAMGNVTVSDPTSMTPVIGWVYQSAPSVFSGMGLLENQFGATGGVINGVTGGNNILLSFAFGSSIGSYAQASTAFAGAQIAIQDEGYRVAGCVSRGVMLGSASAQNTSSESLCDSDISTVPEPGTYLLTASGLIGLLGFARRRRAR